MAILAKALGVADLAVELGGDFLMIPSPAGGVTVRWALLCHPMMAIVTLLFCVEIMGFLSDSDPFFARCKQLSHGDQVVQHFSMAEITQLVKSGGVKKDPLSLAGQKIQPG